VTDHLTERPVDTDLATVATTGPIEGGLRDYLWAYLQRIRAGDMGSMPATIGLILLLILFSSLQKSFHSLGNFADLTTQAAPTVVLAMGLVFVLLLGEIDLSAGTAAGVCAAVMAKLMAEHGWSWWTAVLAAAVTGVVIGWFIGWMRSKVQVPSFVITLALFLAFQGVVLWLVNNGNISVNSNTVNAIENSNMPTWAGWLLLVVVVVGFAAVKVVDAAARRKNKLPAEPLSIIGLKLGAMIVLGALAVYGLNRDRSLQKGGTLQVVNGKFVTTKHIALQGVPWAVPLVVALVIGWTIVLGRTRYGRHIYAVGGNAEAARRAGIPVDRIRISVFVICSFMAALSGIGLASEASSVSPAEGAGNTLLLAVGAAVIGGTSLFGGKGRVLDAVIGGIVVAVIANGMADLIQGKNSQAVQEVVTGAVLALAAVVDALSRRRAGSTGLG